MRELQEGIPDHLRRTVALTEDRIHAIPYKNFELARADYRALFSEVCAFCGVARGDGIGSLPVMFGKGVDGGLDRLCMEWLSSPPGCGEGGDSVSAHPHAVWPGIREYSELLTLVVDVANGGGFTGGLRVAEELAKAEVEQLGRAKPDVGDATCKVHPRFRRGDKQPHCAIQDAVGAVRHLRQAVLSLLGTSLQAHLSVCPSEQQESVLRQVGACVCLCLVPLA